MSLKQKLVAEWLGTAFLLAVIVGSGIMGSQLSNGNNAIALLGNTLPTGAILVVLILVFGPISGAHFNPAVSLAFYLRKEISLQHSILYLFAQLSGAICGVIIAHLMFDMALLDISTNDRTGIGKWSGEFIATFGLIMTILGCLKTKPDAIPYAVGLYITAGYWFTSSTSFANPAVTIARGFTDSFSGINPNHIFSFILAQLVATIAATCLLNWLFKNSPNHSTPNEE